MRTPDGHDFYNGGEFLEIVPLEKIVWLWYFADADGNRVNPSHYGFPPTTKLGSPSSATTPPPPGKSRKALPKAFVRSSTRWQGSSPS